MTEGSRAARWRGLLGLAVHRALRGRGARQLALAVGGVAVPVALMLVVTGVSVGLAAGTTVESPDVDYWIVPESGSAESAVVSAGGPRFGRVHAASDRLDGRAGVTYATPVQLELLRAEVGARSEYVLAVGVIPGERPVSIAGASTAGLTPGDPYYAGGAYDGRWTGEVVLSAAAAELLGAEQGSGIGFVGVGDGRGFAVAAVSEADDPAPLPVAVVHLSELQALTGAASGDLADQFLVRTDRPGVRASLEGVYPRSTVVSRAGLATGRVTSSRLPLALAATALVVAVVVGLLFAASTLGLAIAADGPNRAVMAAVGWSGRSRAGLVAAEAVVTALVGGAVGVALGFAGIRVANALVARYVIDVPVARAEPLLAGYGVGVAAAIGLLSVPYLLWVGRRTTDVGDLQE